MAIDVEEVSLVGKAANLRQFLVIKAEQEEGQMDPKKEIKEGEQIPQPPAEAVKKEATPPAPPEVKTPETPAPEAPAPAPPVAKADAPADIPSLIQAVQDAIKLLSDALSAPDAVTQSLDPASAATVQKSLGEILGPMDAFIRVIKGKIKPPEKPAEDPLKVVLKEIEDLKKSLEDKDTRLKTLETPRPISKGAGDPPPPPPAKPASIWDGAL